MWPGYSTPFSISCPPDGAPLCNDHCRSAVHMVSYCNTHTHTHTHTHMSLYVLIRMYSCTHIKYCLNPHTTHMHTHAHAHTYTHAHAHTHTYTHAHAHTHVAVSTNVKVCHLCDPRGPLCAWRTYFPTPVPSALSDDAWWVV